MSYSLIRKLLFRLSPEAAHGVSLNALQLSARLGVADWFASATVQQPIKLFGMSCVNPVGLAAGLDKDGQYVDGLAQLGFGFIEVGTVTPRPQPGNARPRLFRLKRDQAIINRMGFNNQGVEQLLANLSRCRYQGPLGINIGKNFDTPVAKAIDDYLLCLNQVYHRADYVVVNLSSPNTPGLRELQFGSALTELLQTLKKQQAELQLRYQKYTPLVIKLAPDMLSEDIQAISQTLLANKVDGVIATNTTLDRPEQLRSNYRKETGGLSGAPLFAKSTDCLRQLSQCLEGQIPLIGVGGILSGEQALEKINAGAEAVQLYSGLIYRGPQLIREAAQTIKNAQALAAQKNC